MKELELVPFLEPPSDARELGVELVCLFLELGLDIRIVADRNAGYLDAIADHCTIRCTLVYSKGHWKVT